MIAMKVRDLVKKLQSFDQDVDVLCSSEDESLQRPNELFRVFEIQSVELTDAEKRRGSDGIVSLKLGKTDLSQPHVLIDITTGF